MCCVRTTRERAGNHRDDDVLSPRSRSLKTVTAVTLRQRYPLKKRADHAEQPSKIFVTFSNHIGPRGGWLSSGPPTIPSNRWYRVQRVRAREDVRHRSGGPTRWLTQCPLSKEQPHSCSQLTVVLASLYVHTLTLIAERSAIVLAYYYSHAYCRASHALQPAFCAQNRNGLSVRQAPPCHR